MVEDVDQISEFKPEIIEDGRKSTVLRKSASSASSSESVKKTS